MTQNIDRTPIEKILGDPITSTLLKNSNLTLIQLETLLINFFVDEIEGYSEKYEVKSQLRKIRHNKGHNTPKKKTGVSRGAYHRVLGQSCSKVIKTIYTITLLAYVGILETPSLEPYLQLVETIRDYLEDLGINQKSETLTKEDKSHLIIIRKRIIETLNKYIDPFILSGRKSTQ
ncbi:MAG: hypothetical protein ACTSUV_00160 [Candidatus Ranarchaeia archaeon]